MSNIGLFAGYPFPEIFSIISCKTYIQIKEFIIGPKLIIWYPRKSYNLNAWLFSKVFLQQKFEHDVTPTQFGMNFSGTFIFGTPNGLERTQINLVNGRNNLMGLVMKLDHLVWNNILIVDMLGWLLNLFLLWMNDSFTSLYWKSQLLVQTRNRE